MSTQNIIKKFTGLQDVNIKDIKENEKSIEIHIDLDVKEHKCPCCGCFTSKVHDYCTQKITDIPYRGKSVILVYRKRRYICSHCKKRFYDVYAQ